MSNHITSESEYRGVYFPSIELVEDSNIAFFRAKFLKEGIFKSKAKIFSKTYSEISSKDQINNCAVIIIWTSVKNGNYNSCDVIYNESESRLSV